MLYLWFHDKIGCFAIIVVVVATIRRRPPLPSSLMDG
jgi:hypothetical protein